MAAVGTAVQYRESATAAWWAATVIFIPPDAGTTRRLAVTAPDRALSMHRVSPEVNRVAIDAERLVRPLVGAMDQPDFFGDLLG